VSASVPPPPEVASDPGAHLAPSHFKTFPVTGGEDVVSTSLRKLMLNALILISTLSVSVAIDVDMFVPPIMLSVSLILAAVVDPSSAVIVPKASPPPPVLLIVSVSPTIEVVVLSPPAIVRLSVGVLAVVNPESALNLVKRLVPATGVVTTLVITFQLVPSYFQVVLPSVNVSLSAGVPGKFIAIIVPYTQYLLFF
jgi:hypothetical protein